MHSPKGPNLARAMSRSLIHWMIVLFAVALWAGDGAPQETSYTTPLATGKKLDAVGEAIQLGSMPLALLATPDRDKIVVVLSGWREQGIQVVDVATKQVLQTEKQEAAFFGAAFSPTKPSNCLTVEITLSR